MATPRCTVINVGTRRDLTELPCINSTQTGASQEPTVGHINIVNPNYCLSNYTKLVQTMDKGGQPAQPELFAGEFRSFT